MNLKEKSGETLTTFCKIPCYGEDAKEKLIVKFLEVVKVVKRNETILLQKLKSSNLLQDETLKNEKKLCFTPEVAALSSNLRF